MQIQCEQADQFSVGGDQRLGVHLSQLPLEYPWDRGCNTQDNLLTLASTRVLLRVTMKTSKWVFSLQRDYSALKTFDGCV